MLLLKALLLNLAVLLPTGLAGWLPTRFLESRTGGFSPAFRLFSALFLGFILIQTVFALWVTRGLTMQLLNLIPFGLLAFLPRQPSLAQPARPLPEVWMPAGVLLISVLYFVRSYAGNWLETDHYAFIDLVSYAASAYGMGQAGAEVSFSDTALYFPGLSRLNLYHFTELWFTRLIALASGETELWVVCFVLPVFLLVLLATGVQAAAPELPRPFLLVLTIAIIFSFGKLAFAHDIFFYHVLDLCGIKISLIIPAFLFLLGLRGEKNIWPAFALILLQINILLGVLVALLAIPAFLTLLRQPRKADLLRMGSVFALTGIAFLLLLRAGGQSTGGPDPLPFSGSAVVHTFFLYSREAFFNLGFNYWLPFLALAALFRSRLFALLPLPYAIAKVAGKGLVFLLPGFATWQAGAEVVFCLTGLWLLNRRLLHFSSLTEWGAAAILLLCAVGSVGYALTGFMDFEQIYTLTACSFFFILCLHLFLLPLNPAYPPILNLPRQNLWLAAGLLALVAGTFRLQRVLPFDTAFRNQIREEAGTVTRSAYFSTKKYSPFPLHVKAGFPLLYDFPDAHSTPVTQFEDSSWQGKDIAWHVRLYPFYRFCGLSGNRILTPQQQKIRFLQQFNIRFVWVDSGYPGEKLAFLEPSVLKKWKSEKDQKELWKIDPARLR